MSRLLLVLVLVAWAAAAGVPQQAPVADGQAPCPLASQPSGGEIAPSPIQPTGPIVPPPQQGIALTLEQAVATALRYNPALMASREGVAIARDRLAAARAARRPLVTAAATYTRVDEVSTISMFMPDAQGNFTLQTFELGSKENGTLDATVSAPIYSGGALRAGERAAQAGVQAQVFSERRDRQQVAFAVRQAYYRVLTAMDQVTVARQALAAAEEQLRVAQAFVTAETAPRFDQIRAQATVEAARLQVTAATNQEKLARVALNNVMGVAQECTFNLTTVLRREPAVGELDRLLATALQERPDLLALRATERSLRESVTIARAARRPTLGLTFNYNAPLEESTFSMGGWTLALGANFNIFTFGRTKAAINEARDVLDQTKALREQLLQSISLEVRQAYLNASTALEQITSASAELEAANEALRIAQVRYQAGVGTPLEVIDAQAARQSAATNYNVAVFNYNLAIAQLELALGSEPEPGVEPVNCPLPTGGLP